MKFRKNLLAAILTIAILAPSFASSANFDAPTADSKALKEITTIIQDIDIDATTLDVEKVKVHFMINTNNEVVVLRTNNQELDRTIKSELNYTSLESRDLEVNQVYILPVTFQ